MKKNIAMMMAVVMCAAALTACGSTETNADSSAAANNSTAETSVETSAASTEAASTEAAEGTEAASTEQAAAAGTLEEGVLLVGTNAEFPPFEYVGDSGEPEGFDIALIQAIGEKLGLEVQVQNMEFASLVAAIGTKVDAVIAGMTVTEERQAAVDFSENYYEAVQSVIVRADSDIKTAADLENKVIGAQLDTTGNFIAEEIPGAEAKAYNKGADAVNDLINGRIDAVIIDTNPAQVFADKFEGEIVALDGADFEFEPEYYAIALPKGSGLVEQVNQALADLKADGTFDALVAEYIGGAE